MKNLFSCAVLSVLLGAVGVASAEVAWTNLDADHYLAGRKCSSGYLAGKVVLVCSDTDLAARMEEVWTSFRTKPFVLLGSFETAPQNVTYPVYQACGLATEAPQFPLYLVDETGAIRYKGKDDRLATEMAVTLLTDMAAPKSVKSFKYFLDFEIQNLPGRAIVRQQEFKKAFPKDAKEYEGRCAGLAKLPDMKKLAELVAFAAKAKDYGVFDPKKGKAKKAKLLASVKSALSKYEPLKSSKDPQVVREAKNSLADLAWTKADLEN